MKEVGFIIDDIAAVEADVIVNSIGVGDGLKEYGGICSSILAKTNSNELKNKIDNAKDIYVLGEYFVTQSYGLPCKYIINLITPYYEDDPEMVIYADCIRRVLNECRRLAGVKTIAIPVVGVGANHYEKSSALNIISNISSVFMQTYQNKGEPKYLVTIVDAEEKVSEENRARIARQMPLDGERENIKKDVKKGSSKYLKTYRPQPLKIVDGYKYFRYGSEEQSRRLIIFAPGFKRVFDYARAYTDKRYSNLNLKKQADDRLNAFLGYGYGDPKNVGSKFLSAMKSTSEIDSFYIIALALKMEIKEAEHFLHYFGKSFSAEGIDERSDIVKKLLEDHIYDFYEIKDKINFFD